MTTAVPVQRSPVTVQCKHCSTSYETTADITCRCPNCHALVRIPAAIRRERDRISRKPQAVVPVQDKPQVRARPEPAPAPAPVIPLRPKAAVAKRNAPEPIPDDDDWPDDDDYEEQVRRAQLDMVAASIRSNARTHPGPTGAIQMGMLPRVLVTDESTGSVIGAVVRRAANKRGKPVDNVPRCAHCGIRAGLTPGLYRVDSPALLGERVLCHLHMQQEAVIAGVEISPL